MYWFFFDCSAPASHKDHLHRRKCVFMINAPILIKAKQILKQGHLRAYLCNTFYRYKSKERCKDV